MDGGFNAKKKMKYKKIYPHETLFLKKKKNDFKYLSNVCYDIYAFGNILFY